MNEKILTNEELDKVVNTASESDNGKMAELKESVEIDPNAELESEEVLINPETNEIDLIAKKIDEDLDVDLMDATNPEALSKATTDKVLKDMDIDLEDEEGYEFVSLINEYRSNNNIPNIYDRLPLKFRNTIDELIKSTGANPINKNNITKMVLNEFIGNSEVEAAFVDFEKALNKTLDIPSMVDMYGDHTRTVMEENVPKMIEKIKDEEPEKAEMLRKVKESFTKSYTFEAAKEAYINNTTLRKFVRRSDFEFKRSLEDFNKKNANTKFKVYDVFEVPKALAKVLCADPVSSYAKAIKYDMEVPESTTKLIELNTTEDDIKKFCILITESCSDLDPENVIDISYMYYLVKNIVMLKYTQEAKTDFAAELINNICDVIALIRNKEAEFYAENPHLVKSKQSKKSHSASGGKK